MTSYGGGLYWFIKLKMEVLTHGFTFDYIKGSNRLQLEQIIVGQII